MNDQTFWQRWFSRVTAEVIITGAVPALLLGAWAWQRLSGS